jgi:signal transduction histidine kinase
MTGLLAIASSEPTIYAARPIEFLVQSARSGVPLADRVDMHSLTHCSLAGRQEDKLVWLLFDANCDLIIDAVGATFAMLGYRASYLRGQPLSLLFDSTEGSGLAGPRRPLQASHPARLEPAFVRTRSRKLRRVNASITTFRSGEGGNILGVLQLGDCDATSGGECNLASDRQHLQTLAYELSVAEARERERVANGLHDTIGQLLAIAQFKLGELESSLHSPPLRQRSQELGELIAQAAQETRRATFDLHSPLLRQVGLQAAIEALAERMRRQGCTNFRVEGSLETSRLASTVQAVALRVVRELLLNAYKHAGASTVTINLASAGARQTISVTDDGRGFVGCGLTRTFGPGGGFGLASSEAQMQAIGGRLCMESVLEHGTTATISLPCRRRRVPTTSRSASNRMAHQGAAA